MKPVARTSQAAPTLDVDLYADAGLSDSRELFARIRDAGPVVWLPCHRTYAVGRSEEVRSERTSRPIPPGCSACSPERPT